MIRIPSPEQGYGYPDENGYYLTYSNAVFVNNKVILPTYYTYDCNEDLEDALPDMNVGIDCDSAITTSSL